MSHDAPTWGTTVEDYARRLAGALGVADFVYQPALERKGSAQREISDGVLACGDEGLILQVKARDPQAASLDSPVRAEAWIKSQSRALRKRTARVGDLALARSIWSRFEGSGAPSMVSVLGQRS